MSGLITITVLEGEQVVFTETVPHAMARIEAIEKDATILGRPTTFRFEFDPPVVCPPATTETES